MSMKKHILFEHLVVSDAERVLIYHSLYKITIRKKASRDLSLAMGPS